MSNDFRQWRRDRELIHFEKEEHDRYRGRRPFRALWWVLLAVIVLPILLHSCAQAFRPQGRRADKRGAAALERDQYARSESKLYRGCSTMSYVGRVVPSRKTTPSGEYGMPSG